MGWIKVLLILVAISSSLPQGAVADILSPLSPLLSPVLNGICNGVNCGKGNCQASLEYTFGFACVCKPGWRQFHLGDHLRFLPCIIPNCSIDYSCTNTSVLPAPAPVPPPSNDSIFDACMWSYCGGGECSATSHFEHKCVCNEGYDNLLNITAFPCFKECSLGADCSELGITLSNSTSNVASSPPNLPDNGSSAAGDFTALKKSIWFFTLVTSLAIV